MKRNAIVDFLIREMAEEMPFVLRALPDDRIWSAMIAGLIGDEDVDTLAVRIARFPMLATAAADWREIYGEMRDMINEWPGAKQAPTAMAA